MTRRTWLFTATALAAALLAPAAAQAAPPALVSAGRTSDDRPTASWTLPAGGASTFVEISKSPALGEDGAFANAVTEEFPDPDQTSWTATDPLDPGTYYLHVAGAEEDCDGCPPEEWSSVSKLIIAPRKPKPGSYTGPVSSSGKISFKVSSAKKARVRNLKISFPVKCRHGRTAMVTIASRHLLRVKKNKFSAAVKQKKSSIRGRLKLQLSGNLLGGTRARGTLRATIHKTRFGECATQGGKGKGMDWSAARGSG